jgi:hypothetical protein
VRRERNSMNLQAGALEERKREIEKETKRTINWRGNYKLAVGIYYLFILMYSNPLKKM